jgi:hypothetical protein
MRVLVARALRTMMRIRYGGRRNLTVVGVVTIALGLAAPAVAVASPCAKAVVLEGPGSLREPIARRLEASGVAVGAAGSCPAVRVRLSSSTSASASGFDLLVEDRFGRTSHRKVSDPGTAVSLIESWAAGLDANLPVDGSGASGAPIATNVSLAAPDAVAVPGRLRVYGGFARDLGGDQSIGGGGLAGACLRAGPACVGMELYVAHDLVGAGAAADLLFTAALPFETEHWLLMPGIGLGPGWTRAQFGADSRMNAAGETVDSVGFRSALSLIAGARLTARVVVGLDIGAVVAPAGRTDWPRAAWGGTSSYSNEPPLSGRAGLVCVVTP